MKTLCRALIYFVVGLLFCVPTYFVQAEGAVGGEITQTLSWELDNDGMLIISGSGDIPDYSLSSPAPWETSKARITSVVTQEGVGRIGNHAFSGCSLLKNVYLAGTLKSLGEYCFFQCESLKEIAVPGTVSGIGDYAFAGCTALAAVDLPDNLTSLGKGAFLGTEQLREVLLPGKLSQISESLFYGSGIETMEIPSLVTGIASDAFADTKLAEITIPISVKTIENSAFFNVSALTDVNYAGSLSQAENIDIGSGNDSLLSAVWHCAGGDGEISSGIGGALNASVSWSFEEGLLTITGRGNMPDFDAPDAVPWREYGEEIISASVESGVTSVGNYAFFECKRLKTILLTDDVIRLGDNCFYGCEALEEVIVPSAVKTIGGYAFAGCTALCQISFPSNLKSLGEGALQGTVSLFGTELPSQLTSVSEYLFYGSGLQSIEIPQGVTVIKSAAFADSGLTDVMISASVTNIGPSAFGFLDELTNVTYTGTKEQALKMTIGAENDSLLRATWHCSDGTGMYPFDSEDDPGSDNRPFDGIADVLTLPSALIAIEDQAFWGTAEQAVVIPEGTESIGSMAFANSDNLRYVKIPESVVSIASDAFSGSDQVVIICKADGEVCRKVERMGIAWISEE